MIDYVMFICYLSMLIRSCGSISLGCRKIGRFSVTLLSIFKYFYQIIMLYDIEKRNHEVSRGSIFGSHQ